MFDRWDRDELLTIVGISSKWKLFPKWFDQAPSQQVTRKTSPTERANR
jgi:hypothetical protein